MKFRFWVISLLVISILFLTSCKNNEKVDTSDITPQVTLNNNSTSENISDTNKPSEILNNDSTSENMSDANKQSEMKSPTTEKSSIKNTKCRLYFLAATELEYYYIDKIIPVEDNALITALTKELQSTSYNKDFLSLTDKIKVKSAKVDETTGVLKIVFSGSYVDHMNLGTNTEDGLLTSLLATYGYNLGVDKVAIYFNDELYTSVKGDLPEGYFNVNYPSAKVYNP
ncbi:sporulation and spore germination protein [Alkalibaculum bacchi]|uniref:Sporulation and spore germination protein n=1 Tax=Alkalibaculum bacchi TaxID=645887 RepID=A0A366ID19_9FIRM|nr:GerMN domain-containing protein [Alkalibaculum bacchi]RBP68883.1 sporulation and spore germination protein [Alkalibaculum bacchi]